MKRIIQPAVIAALLLSSMGAMAQKSGYHLLNTFHISGLGRWDYIAVNGDRVYVSHTNQVNILNKNTGDSVGVISNTEGVHGIAFAPAFKKGFTSNGKANTVTVFDINTNQAIAQIKTGENPDAIMFDPFTKKVIVCNGHSKDISIIDPASNAVIKTIAVGGKPETAVSDNAGMIYVNVEDKNEVVAINAKTFTVEHHWKVGKGDEPSGLSIDTKTKRLFAGCGNKTLVVMDAANGKVIKELAIGDGCDGVAFDNSKKLIFSSNGEGTLTVIKENGANDFSVVENVNTQKGAKTLTVDEQTHKVYLPTADLTAPEPGQKKPGVVPGTFRVLVLGQ